MGRGGGVAGGRPSQTAYFVALAAVAALLLMLLCYFLYYCISRISELSERASLCGSRQGSRAAPPPARDEYPVRPGVRDGATAMAKLCKQLPGGSAPGPRAAGPALGAAAAASVLGAAGVLGARGGSVASTSEATTLSEDTATTDVSAGSPPPPT